MLRLLSGTRLRVLAACATFVMGSAALAGGARGMKCQVADNWFMEATVQDSFVTLNYWLEGAETESSIIFPLVSEIPTDAPVYHAFAVTRPELAGGSGPTVVVRDNGSERLVPLGEAIRSLPVEALLFAAQEDEQDLVDVAAFGVMHRQGESEPDTWMNDYTTCIPGTVTKYFGLKTPAK